MAASRAGPRTPNYTIRKNKGKDEPELGKMF
jgi:hypothetical protein